MQVTIKDGYVDSYAIIGELTDGIEVKNPADMDYFETHFKAYKCNASNILTFDIQRARELEEKKEVEELRRRREVECFSIINRGKLWYDSLAPYQISKLEDWYDAWLQVTETLKVPEKPEFL